jgi:pyruvate/2-oxoglutarate dehydrogenase complex dihydrolipoamide acyltransferase (E2) component
MDEHEIRRFSPMRRLVLDAGWMARRRHMIHGLIEIDVTEPRRRIAAYDQAHGERLSFSAFVSGCVGRSVAQDRSVHAYRDWRGRLVLFTDVDIMMAVAASGAGKTTPRIHVLRGTNRRSVLDMHEEIRDLQQQARAEEQSAWLTAMAGLPAFVRHTIYRVLLRSPQLQKQYAGTVGLTSVGMFGSRGGWGLGMPNHSLALTLGGISRKPGVVGDQIAIREYLALTLSFDHNIVDGAPAAQFSERLADLIEAGTGLP